MLTLGELLEQLAGEGYDNSLLGQSTIISAMSKDEFRYLAEKLTAYYNNYGYWIQKRADEIMYHEPEEYRKFVVGNAKECLLTLDIETLMPEKHYNVRALASEKVEDYLNMQKYLSDEDEMLLKTYLPPIVVAAVLHLQMSLLEQPEFLNQAIGTHHERIADLNDRMQLVEFHENNPVSPAYLVADITMELKNRWYDYPFLEQPRKDGQRKELREFYKLPYGKFKEDDVMLVDIHKLLQETIDSGNDHRKRMLVLLGAPGSGKTTVITYLLNELKIDRPVRVYPLAGFTIMSLFNWPGELLARMGLVQKDLDNSVLILDGLDELDLYGRYEAFVEKLRMAWANNDEITNFTLILTCRTNRLMTNDLGCSYVTLASLSERQIQELATDYLGECPPGLKYCLAEKEDICNLLGVPVLLYLVLSLGFNIGSDTTIASLYDMIFSLDGDNCIYKRSYDWHKHPITAALAEKIHLFSQDVAVAMFSKEDVQEDLEKASYIPIAQKVIGNDLACSPEDLLIGQYFLLGHKKHKIYFAHRSIFEYFVALSVFNALVALARSDKNAETLYREMSPGKYCTLTPVAELLCWHTFSEFPGIESFLHYLIHTHIDQLQSFDDWADLMKLYYTCGLTDAICDYPHGGRRGLQEENNQLFNLLDICRTILVALGENNIDLLPELYHNKRINGSPNSSSEIYFPVKNLRMKDMSNLDLRGCNFSHMVVSGARFSCSDCSHSNWSKSEVDRTDFTGSKLAFADLREASFVRCIFKEADFTCADLACVDFSYSDLSGADLSNANVTGANFTGVKVSHTNLYRSNLSGNQTAEKNSVEISLNKNRFEYFDFVDKDFSYSHWSGNNLCGSDFSGARLCHVDLSGADLSWAKFTRADLSHANLKDANLKNSILDECTFNQCILPDGRLYEDAVEQDGIDVILQFTDG